MLKSAILGCGGRSRHGHAPAYEHVTKSSLAAICDMDENRLNAYGDQFNVSNRYTDFEEMLEQEKPDLLHIVTPPSLRASLLKVAIEHRVPGVLIEKPIALMGEDYREVAALAGQTTKIAVNHQLRYHPNCQMLQQLVHDGRIGEVLFINASARLGLAGQGTHITNLMFAFNGDSPPVKTFGQVSGKEGLDNSHPAPNMAVAELLFENGVSGLFSCGKNAPRARNSDPDLTSHHKRIAVYGTRGFVHWTMNGLEMNIDGRYERLDYVYAEQDILGQAAMTDALADWIEDDSKVHGNCLATSLREMLFVLALYISAIERRPVEMPFDPPDGLLNSLEEIL